MVTAQALLLIAGCLIDGTMVRATPQGEPELELFAGAEARCEGGQLAVFDPSWPVPWRLVREPNGAWRESVLPQLAPRATVVDRFFDLRRWISREEALATWAKRNKAVVHASNLPQLEKALAELKREALPKLLPFTRLGSMPGAQSLAGVFWSGEALCVEQGDGKRVRCYSPGKGWGKTVARASRPPSASDAAFTYASASGTVKLGPLEWHVSELVGAPWQGSVDARACAEGVPRREAVEARECEDPDSQRCLHWGRYGPAEWAMTCEEVVERLVWSPDGRSLVVMVRHRHDQAADSIIGLWLATVEAR